MPTRILIGLLLLLAGCGPSEGPGPAPEWGQEARGFFDSQVAAVCSHDFHDVARFYDIDAVGDYRAVMFGDFPGQLREGRPAIMSFLDVCLLAPTRSIPIEVEDVFLHPSGALTIERWTVDDNELFVAVFREIGPNGIELERYFPASPQATLSLMTEPHGPGPEGATPFDPDAALDAVEEFVEKYETELGDDLSVFPFLGPDGRLEQLVAVFTERPPACAQRTAIWWTVDGDVIVGERRFVDIITGPDCVANDLPTGWWTELALPGPLDQRLAEQLSVSGQTIDLYNSDADRRALVEWGFARFEANGLTAPPIDAVVFEPSVRCADFAGLIEARREATTVYVCIKDVVCRYPSCDEYSASAKRAFLHELAHGWLEAHVGISSMQRFMTLTETSKWNDPAHEWNEHGVEWAAEVIAWGVSDERLGLVRLGFPSCQLLAEGFEVLTSQPASWSCEQDE